MSCLVVIGSMTTDFVVNTVRPPQMGETIEGEQFETFFGGKGANQAVVAARLGAEVSMIGAVGDDTFGEEILANLTDCGVDTSGVKIIPDQSSGSAHITVVDGDNAIVIVLGANGDVEPQLIAEADELLADVTCILLQNELPVEVVEYVIDYCYQRNITLLYDPAPAREISIDLLEKVDYLTPNETEFSVLFPEQTISDVLANYPNQLIVTLGDKGVKYHDGTEIVHVPAPTIDKVVDSTGAGDTFNGALAVQLSKGKALKEAIRFASAAAALSVTKRGAQTGAPTEQEVNVQLVQDH